MLHKCTLYDRWTWDARGGYDHITTGSDRLDALLDGVIKEPEARVLSVAHVVTAHTCVWHSHADPRLSHIKQKPKWVDEKIDRNLDKTKGMYKLVKDKMATEGLDGNIQTHIYQTFNIFSNMNMSFFFHIPNVSRI